MIKDFFIFLNGLPDWQLIGVLASLFVTGSFIVDRIVVAIINLLYRRSKDDFSSKWQFSLALSFSSVVAIAFCLLSFFWWGTNFVQNSIYQVISIVKDFVDPYVSADMSYLVSAIVVYSSITLIFLGVSYMLIKMLIKKRSKTKIIQSHLMVFIIAVRLLFLAVSPFLFLALFVLYAGNYSSCGIWEFMQFDAHIKSLCVERADKSECPKNETELRAFRPELFAQLAQCTRYRYDFNANTQTATFIVRTQDGPILISHKMFYPDFGHYTLRSEDTAGGLKLYPPATPGPWYPLP